MLYFDSKDHVVYCFYYFYYFSCYSEQISVLDISLARFVNNQFKTDNNTYINIEILHFKLLHLIRLQIQLVGLKIVKVNPVSLYIINQLYPIF